MDFFLQFDPIYIHFIWNETIVNLVRECQFTPQSRDLTTIVVTIKNLRTLARSLQETSLIIAANSSIARRKRRKYTCRLCGEISLSPWTFIRNYVCYSGKTFDAKESIKRIYRVTVSPVGGGGGWNYPEKSANISPFLRDRDYNIAPLFKPIIMTIIII